MSSKFVKQIDGKPVDFQLQQLIAESDCDFSIGGLTAEQENELLFAFNQSKTNRLPLDYLHRQKLATNICQWENNLTGDLTTELGDIILNFGSKETDYLDFNSIELIHGYELQKRISNRFITGPSYRSFFVPHKAGTYDVRVRFECLILLQSYPEGFNTAFIKLNLYKNGSYIKRMATSYGWTYVKSAEAIFNIFLNFTMNGTAFVNLNPGDEIGVKLSVDFTSYLGLNIQDVTSTRDFEAGLIYNQNATHIQGSNAPT